MKLAVNTRLIITLNLWMEIILPFEFLNFVLIVFIFSVTHMLDLSIYICLSFLMRSALFDDSFNLAHVFTMFKLIKLLPDDLYIVSFY